MYAKMIRNQVIILNGQMLKRIKYDILDILRNQG
jgi:hypothetical protein